MLYEMLTGQRPFRGESRISTLAAILREEPRPVTEVVPGLPSGIDALVSRCLRKDPDRRFQSMADVRAALVDLREESDTGQAAAAAVAAHPRRQIPWLWMAIAAVAVIAALSITAVHLTTHNGGHAREVPAPVRLTDDAGCSGIASISRDGKLVVFSSDRSGEGHFDLWLMQLASSSLVRLTSDPGDDSFPEFSPDGSRIVYMSDRNGGSIWTVPSLGGSQPTFLAAGRMPHYSPDGERVLYLDNSKTWGATAMRVIPASGGAPQHAVSRYEATAAFYAPDGKHLLFMGGPNGAEPRSIELTISPLDGVSPVTIPLRVYAERHKLAYPRTWGFLPGNSGNVWRLLFSAREGMAETLWTVGVRRNSWTLDEHPVRLTTPSESRHLFPSVAADGTLIFSGARGARHIWTLPIDANGKRTGERRRVTVDASYETSPYVSENGAKLAYDSQRAIAPGIYVRDLKSGAETRVVAAANEFAYPTLNPDGSKLALTRREGDTQHLKIYATSGGAEQTLCSGCGMVRDWSPDGRWVLAQGGDPLSRIDLIDAQSGRIATLFTDPEFSLHSGEFTKDGKWIAFYGRSKTGMEKLFAAEFRDGKGSPRAEWSELTDGTAADNKPRWSADGNVVYFMSDREGVDAVWAVRVDARKRPVGSPFVVDVLRRGVSLRMDGGLPDLSVGRDSLYFTFGEVLANLWRTKLPEE